MTQNTAISQKEVLDCNKCQMKVLSVFLTHASLTTVTCHRDLSRVSEN